MKNLLKLLKRHKRATGIVSLLVVVAVIFCIVNSPVAISTSVTSRSLPIYCVQRDDKCVSLTFDAAWGNEDTQQLINILATYNVRATFFVVGAWVDKYPESVKALSDAGHEIMTHSDDHAHFNALSSEQIISNINTSCDKIEAVTGIRPTLFRPPYGEYNDHVVQTITDMGMLTIQWDVETTNIKIL